MVRRLIKVLSPIAALAIVWGSLQSFAFTADENAAEQVPQTQSTSVVQRDLLPELGSVSQILATTSTRTPGEKVPASVRRILIASGAVLLVEEGSDTGDRL